MVNTDQQVLVIRFSSLGDVLLLIPVFRTLEKELPNFRFTLLTHQDWRSFFDSCPNVDVIGVDLKDKHSGFRGLWKLFKSLSKTKWHSVIDVHDVIRSRMLCQLMSLAGNTIYRYDKRRKQRVAIINGRSSSVLPPISEQYLEAFYPLKPNMKLVNGPWLQPTVKPVANPVLQITIAPFSAHEAKEWALEHWQQLLREIALFNAEAQLYCLAFSERELKLFSKLKSSCPNLNLVDAHFDVEQQIEMLDQMDAVISVDSANMHLAALLGKPVISLWGTTSPKLGFRPLGMEAYILEADSKPDRPRSVYGKLKSKNAIRKAQVAMQSITIDQVMEKLISIIVSQD